MARQVRWCIVLLIWSFLHQLLASSNTVNNFCSMHNHHKYSICINYASFCWDGSICWNFGCGKNDPTGWKNCLQGEVTVVELFPGWPILAKQYSEWLSSCWTVYWATGMSFGWYFRSKLSNLHIPNYHIIW